MTRYRRGAQRPYRPSVLRLPNNNTGRRRHGYLPVDDLVRALGSRSPSRLEDIYDIPRRTMQRWLRTGRIPWRCAELVCEHNGIHPAEVFGAAYYEVAA